MSKHLDEITITKQEALSLGIIGNKGLGFVQKDLYKQINKRILDYIKSEKDLPWRKPWRDGYKIKSVTYGPQNYVTGNPYRGANAYAIMLHNIFTGRNDNYFLTRKQIAARGGKLKKDAVSVYVWAFIKGTKVRQDKEGKEVKSHYEGVVTYEVFPIGETEGVKPIKRKTAQTSDTNNEVIVSAEEIINGMPKRPPIKNDGGDRAFYRPSTDSVHMPPKKAFDELENYYAVLFHELVHSTGNEKRIGRPFGKTKGDKLYAFEELIAEIGSAYLCGVSNIAYYNLKNSAAYLKGWASMFQENLSKDKTFLFRAILAATKASKYIIGTTLEKKGEIVPEGEKQAQQKIEHGKHGQYKMNLQGTDIKDPGLQIIYRYLKLHGTTVKKSAVKKFIQDLQADIKKGTIKKSHPYAEHIELIQDQLVRLYNIMGSTAFVEIAKGKEYREIIERELSGLGFLPVVAAAAGGKLVEKMLEKVFNRKKEGVSGLNRAKKKSDLSGANEAVKSEKTQVKKTTELPGFVRADQEAEQKAPDTFRVPGEIGKFLQDIQPFKYSIVLTGDTHAGKSETIWQLLNAFAATGKEVALYDLEQGGIASKDTRAARDRNVDTENIKRIHITGEAPRGIQTLKEVASTGVFQVIAVDSYQKLKAKPSEFDDLRHEHPNIIWIIIFQQNTEGGTRGGNIPDYDSPVHLKVHRVDHTFKNNYVELKKNRGNSLDRKYFISDKKTISLTTPQKIKENGKSK